MCLFLCLCSCTWTFRGTHVHCQSHLHLKQSHESVSTALHRATGWCTHAAGAAPPFGDCVLRSLASLTACRTSRHGNMGKWCHSSKNRPERLDTNAGQKVPVRLEISQTCTTDENGGVSTRPLSHKQAVSPELPTRAEVEQRIFNVIFSVSWKLTNLSKSFLRNTSTAPACKPPTTKEREH